MRLSVHHTIRFDLGAPARALEHLLLTPMNTAQQKVESWTIDMPGLDAAAAFRDGFGNWAHLVGQAKPEGEMTVSVAGEVTTSDKAGVLGRLEYDPIAGLFRRPSPLAKADPVLLEGLSAAGGRIALLHELMRRVHAEAAAPGQRQSAGGQAQGGTAEPVELVHGFIGGARALDIPARYVTGYVLDAAQPGFHAWAEAWDDGLGWVGFDPLLNQCPTEDYVRLASGPDAIGARPIRTVPVWAEMPREAVEIRVVQEPST